MSRFDALYGKRWNTLVSWNNRVKESSWTNFFKEMEQEVIKIKQNLKTTQDRKTSSVDNIKMHKEFKFG